MINTELKDDGFHPPRRVRLRLRNMGGVANAGGGRSPPPWPTSRNTPMISAPSCTRRFISCRAIGDGTIPVGSWKGSPITSGSSNTSPGKLGPIDADKAHYNSGYRTSAAFLNHVATKYDKELVVKLNQLLRKGEYKPEAFKEMTGKTLDELDAEWRESLGAKKTE